MPSMPSMPAHRPSSSRSSSSCMLAGIICAAQSRTFCELGNANTVANATAEMQSPCGLVVAPCSSLRLRRGPSRPTRVARQLQLQAGQAGRSQGGRPGWGGARVCLRLTPVTSATTSTSTSSCTHTHREIHRCSNRVRGQCGPARVLLSPVLPSLAAHRRPSCLQLLLSSNRVGAPSDACLGRLACSPYPDCL